MHALSGQRMFSVEGTVYLWEDVVLAGCLWGEWLPLERRVRDGLACLARLDELDDADADALDEADVDTAATEFRYARDLVAAADVDAWLERRGLSVDAWLDFVRRSLLLARWTGDLAEIRRAYEVDEDEVPGAVVCEAICGGLAGSLTERLAARAAIHARDGDPVAAPDADAVPTAVAEELLDRAVPDLPSGERRDRLARLARLEAAWRRFVAGAAPPEALARLVAARRLDWVRLAVQSVAVPDADVARELALCVRVDRRGIAEVAAQAGLRVETAAWWLEDVEETLRDALVAAQAGDVVGPLPAKEGHVVLTVTGKQLPTESDPAVRVRAERALLTRTVEHEVASRVRWHVTL
jgi:hypothetical protein